MASLKRSAKSGSGWSDNKLLAFKFNIQVVDANIATFFNTTQLPPPTVSATILNNQNKPVEPLVKDDRLLFFQYMGRVEKPRSPESRVDDFAAFNLRIMNYDDENRIICQRKEISFLMAGKRVGANTDVCLVDELEVLLVQEDKRTGSNDDPEPQVIAEAIAAFYQNNLQRKQTGLQPLQVRYIPAITMIGTAPIFYRIPVTSTRQDLVTASYPQLTTVLRFIPPVSNQERYRIDGMRPLANRRFVLQCLEAFKAVID